MPTCLIRQGFWAVGRAPDSMTSTDRQRSRYVNTALQQTNRPAGAAKKRLDSSTADERLLTWTDEDRARAAAFTHSDPWRVQRITSEIVAGFDALAETGPAITMFGSARIPEADPIYQQAREIGRLVAQAGVTVITGGGPGVMEASNRGAMEVGGESVGAGIELPFEQGVNDYVTVGMEFRYFFVRKLMFVKYASGFVFMPGGWGTLDELFEVLTLIQTGKLARVPVVLFGSHHWLPMMAWFTDILLADARISEPDLDIFTISDDVDDTARIMIEAAFYQAQDMIEAEPTSLPDPEGGVIHPAK